jgi:AmmeMemoRadiSam system protein B
VISLLALSWGESPEVHKERRGDAMKTRKRCLPSGWYPAAPAECAAAIEEFLSDFSPPAGRVTGAVVPHAGWYYSGRAAAQGIAALAEAKKPDRVVVYGGHLPAGRQPLAYVEDSWETPLGEQPLDSSFAHDLAEELVASAVPTSYADNTVEIQMPLVRHFFRDIPVIAIHAPADETAIGLADAVADLLRKRKLNAVYIGSADLTHYGPNYGFTPKGVGPASVQWVKTENDLSIIKKAVEMDAPGVIEDAATRRNTCSAGPIAAVIRSAAREGAMKGDLLMYHTSYDVSPNSSFVGYAAIVF